MENCERTDSEAAGTMWEKREKNRAGAGSETGRGNRWIGGEDGVKEIKFRRTGFHSGNLLDNFRCKNRKLTSLFHFNELLMLSGSVKNYPFFYFKISFKTLISGGLQIKRAITSLL